ncbi:response regulator receiver protein [Caballeronia insecticola]|uniref:Response regulator receiver protein n=2 Tax=Caballeronia insecticola TaxID=758793 RepID=R4X3J5_9BURK|nr:response regulator [Caballeronia insecticola]BAN26427.1 response regulator receiver protein [Caballeronia insecticola]
MHSVLVVDDDYDSLLALRFVFEARGFTVFVAGHGKAALSLAVKHVPDIIVTDFEMPELDGIQLCERLRCSPALSTIPVILISGGQPPASAPVLWSAFLSKPVDFHLLTEVVESFTVMRLSDASR